MLVLSRRAGETIVIGDDIKVTVLNIKGKQIGLGFDAPTHVAVHREEIQQKLQVAQGVSVQLKKQGNKN